MSEPAPNSTSEHPVDENDALREIMRRMSPHRAAAFAVDCAIRYLWSRRIGEKLPERMERELRDRKVEPGQLLRPPDGTGPAWHALIMRHHDLLISYVLDGWHHGKDILCNFAEDLRVAGEPWPPWLQEFLIWAVRNGAKAPRAHGGRDRKGRDPYANVDRDYIIAMTVKWIVDLRGGHATRNIATADHFSADPKKESGSSIVARALQDLGIAIGESGVNAIWRESKQGTRNLLNRPLRRRILGR